MARLKLTWEQREFIDRKKRRSKDYDTKILMMFHKIEYFQNKYGYCNKTNEYFQRILNITDYTLQSNIFAVETTGEHRSDSFRINNSYIDFGIQEFKQLIFRLAWHNVNGFEKEFPGDIESVPA